MFGLGVGEILLLFFIILIFFGAKRLPEIGRSMGKGIREFKDSVKEIGDEASRELPPEGPRAREDGTETPPSRDAGSDRRG